MSLLLTSFTTWLPHQKSNAADDLVAIIQRKFSDYKYLRKLPVETISASQKSILAIKQSQVSAIICCGMAESRTALSIEAVATYKQSCIQTTVDLNKLVSQLGNTYISYDAGKFVCEGLYFQVLSHLQHAQSKIPCIFVHVPLLTEANSSQILQDFEQILLYLS